MKLLVFGAILLLASVVYADHHKGVHHKNEKPTQKSEKPSTKLSSPKTAAKHLSHHVPKSHTFVRHSRKLLQPLKPRLKPVQRQASPRQSIQWKSKPQFRKRPVRRFPRKLPKIKSRQATGNPGVRLPAFQNRPIQPIPSLRPVQVVPVQENPRFRRLVTNLRQSASNLRHGIERGNSNLRQSFRTIARNPLPFGRNTRPFNNNPGHQNRRKINLPSIVFKRAEDMTGYQKFTLSEVIYPEKESTIEKRVDNAEDTILVDTPLDIDPRTKNKKNEIESSKVEEVKKNDHEKSPKEFGLRR